MKNIMLAVLIALVFSGLSHALSPFEFDHGNSGRYLLPVLNDLDPALFSGDQTVESLRRFKSGFYIALSWSLRATHTRPESIENVMLGLALVSKTLFALGLLWLAWVLVDGEPERWGLALVLLVCFLFPVAIPVAGVSIGSATMNHSSVSEIVMVFSVALLVSRRFMVTGAINAVDVWVHPLMAVHRMGALALAMLGGERERTRVTQAVGGLAVFAVSVFVYWMVWAPPPLDRHESEILTVAKGVMVHTSPFSQSWAAWLQLVSLLLLAWCIIQRFTAGLADHRFRLMWWSIATGVLIALTMSLLTHASHIPFLIRLQPMRIFVLPWFVCIVLVAVGAVRSFRERDAAWPWLTAVIATSMLHGGLKVIVLALAAVVLLEQTIGKPVVRSRAQSTILFSSLAAVCAGLALFTERSAHFRIGVLTLFLILIAMWLISGRGFLAPGLLASFMVAGAVSSWLYLRVEPANSTGRPRFDPEYYRVLNWIRENTPKNARFATEPQMGFFRARSFRTSVNEQVPAIVWVDPKQSLLDLERANAVKFIFANDNVPLKTRSLRKIGNALGFQFVLTRERGVLDDTPLYSSGPFYVFRVP